MSVIVDRILDVGRDAWIVLLKYLNAIIGIVCAGVVMLNQTNPGAVQTVIAKLTPTQQALATLAFCSVVQFALSRAKKAP